MVRLFDRRMKPIAVHPQKPPGAFSMLAAHLHPHKISGIEKGADWTSGRWIASVPGHEPGGKRC